MGKLEGRRVFRLVAKWGLKQGGHAMQRGESISSKKVEELDALIEEEGPLWSCVGVGL